MAGNTTTTGLDLSYDMYENCTVTDDCNNTYAVLNISTNNFCDSIYKLHYFNVTCEYPIEYAKPMYGYITPVLLVITVIANSLIVVVLSRSRPRSPTSVLLTGMAICDTLTILVPAPWLIYNYTLGNHCEPLAPPAACTVHHNATTTLPNMFHTASIWLTVALAIQRYIFVCHPAAARTWCTMNRVKKAQIYICLAAFLHQIPQCFEFTYFPLHILWNGKVVEVCRKERADWLNYVTMDAYYSFYFGFRVIFIHMVPCISLVVLNLLLFRAMKKAQKKREKLLKDSKKNNECRKLWDSQRTTLMLIVVVTVFLAVEIPVAVVTTLHIISNVFVPILDYHIANILIMTTNFFILLSFPINFAIYCGMSRQFRETFKELFISNSGVRKPRGSTNYAIVNGPRTCTNETIL